MTDWKGPWRCEECGKIGSWTWAEMVRDLGHHYASDIVPECRGKLVPHDRRAPDPEKQELAEALRELYDARVDSDWLIIKGHDEDGHPLSREGVARKQARALLRQHEEEKP